PGPSQPEPIPHVLRSAVMPVVLDETVFDQLNRGNEAVAAIMRQYQRQGETFWITSALETELSKVQANKQLLTDRGLRRDRYSCAGGCSAARTRQLDQFNSNKQADTAAVGLEHNATLFTLDTRFMETYRKVGGAITSPPARTSGPVNYKLARQYPNLRALNVS